MRGTVFSTIGAVTIPPSGAASPLPARTACVIRNGYVITMDHSAGDLPRGDVQVTDGRIAAVGQDLAVPPGTAEIDASHMIVLPGLVETHWHMWNTLLRSMAAAPPGPGYFRVSLGVGTAFGPEDSYQGTRLACMEAVSSGITTVHDWCHNVRSPAHADAGVHALAGSGLRARFSYGCAAGQPNGQPLDLHDLRRLHTEWDGRTGRDMLTLGLACRGLGGSNPHTQVPAQVYRKEIAAARDLGLPVTVHACGPRAATGQIAALAHDGLLGPDLQVVHGNCATEAEIGQVATAGAVASVSPFSELLIGYGMPRTAQFLAAGVTVGLSVDTTVLTGNADMFAIMKLTLGIANGQSGDEFALTPRRMLELATIEGARSLGLAGQTGSLTPGKRADLILVDTTAPNLAVMTDPVHLLVTAAQPANVDTVIVDGRVLKRGGALTAFDPAQVSADARQALARVRARAGA
jgi:cytosine/adenosine deaminase-related metal-dependent hydrolase